jgi:hypothetical protein
MEMEMETQRSRKTRLQREKRQLQSRSYPSILRSQAEKLEMARARKTLLQQQRRHAVKARARKTNLQVIRRQAARSVVLWDEEILVDVDEADTKQPLLIEGSSRILGPLTGEEQQIVNVAMHGMGPYNEVIVKSGADSVPDAHEWRLVPCESDTPRQRNGKLVLCTECWYVGCI